MATTNYFFSRAMPVAAAAANKPYALLAIPGSSLVSFARYTGLVEVSFTLTTAVQTDIGLYWLQGAVGDATTTWTGKSESGTGGASAWLPASSQNVIETAWTIGPAKLVTEEIRRDVLPATVGAKLVWTWPDIAPLIARQGNDVLATYGIGVWNNGGGAGAAGVLNFKWGEGAQPCGDFRSLSLNNAGSGS